MPSTLPLELADQVIDHLHADHTTLQISGLVCRDWVYASRLHLFHSVRLDRKNASEFFHLTKSPNCTIVPAIRNLCLDFKEDTAKTPLDIPWLDNFYSDLEVFDRQPIDHVQFANLRWDSLSLQSQSTLLSTFPNILQLSFSNPLFEDIHEMFGLICASPYLQVLNFPPRCYVHNGTPASYRLSVLSSLTKLSVGSGPTSWHLLPWLLTSNPPPRLTHVTFGYITKVKDAQIYRDFLKGLGSSLHTLRMGFRDEENLDAREAICEHIDLTHNDQLRSIHIHIFEMWEDGSSFVEWLPRLFSQLAPNFLEEIKVSIRMPDKNLIHEFDWATIDRVLTQTRFSRLRRFYLRVEGYQFLEAEGFIQGIVRFIREHLPCCQAVGILELSDGYERSGINNPY